MTLRTERPVTVGLPIGDPNGIGPEIAVKAALDLSGGDYAVVLIGDEAVIERAAKAGGISRPITFQRLERPDEVRRGPGILCVWHLPAGTVSPGAVTPEAGKSALDWLSETVNLALSGCIDAIACAPANKEAMRMAGSPHSGQTEFIASMTGGQAGTVLASGKFRVFQTTSHVSLRKACDMITRERVLSSIRLAHQVLVNDFSIDRPLIAVCGLNPHSGDGGLLGDEELNHIIPAVEQARAEGIKVDGPLPGDTAFVRVKRMGHEGVVAMYHDQANAVLKFMEADPVTVTVGLPIVRTTVGHGTANDIAWKGIADHGCMKAAVEVAAGMAIARRNKAKKQGA